MKARLKYLAPGLALIALQLLFWAFGAPPTRVSSIVFAIGITVFLNLLFNAYQREEKAREELRMARADHMKSLEREQTFYTYARRVFNAQSAVIARLQARLYRKDRS